MLLGISWLVVTHLYWTNKREEPLRKELQLWLQWVWKLSQSKITTKKWKASHICSKASLNWEAAMLILLHVTFGSTKTWRRVAEQFCWCGMSNQRNGNILLIIMNQFVKHVKSQSITFQVIYISYEHLAMWIVTLYLIFNFFKLFQYFLLRSYPVCQRMNEKLTVERSYSSKISLVSCWDWFRWPIHPISSAGNRFILPVPEYFTKFGWEKALPTKVAKNSCFTQRGSKYLTF